MADRDDLSVPSTVGTARSSNGDVGGAVIKVQIGDGGPFRRIPVHRVLSGRTDDKPSYAALRSLIARYAFPGDDDSGRTCEVTTTYVDEDGDAITVSTDEELEDALFGQIAASEGGKNPPVLRLKAEVQVGEDDAAPEPEPEAAVPSGTDARRPRRAESASSASSVHSERRLASGRVGELRWDLMAAEDGELGAEAGEVAERLMRDIVESISPQSGSASAEAEEEAAAGKELKEEDAAAAAAVFPDPPFIHFWHTCDGCGATPIVGVRHHATDRTDYDLCQGCFDSSVDDAGRGNFVPEELDRDRAMQCRWARRFRAGRLCPSRGGRCQRRHQRRQMRRGCNSNNKEEGPPSQTFSEKLQETPKETQDDNDAELQEAVLRSVQDAREPSEAEGAEDLKAEKKESAHEAGGAALSPTVPPAEDGPANSWRNVAESFSSAAAGSGDFARALGAAAAKVASEVDKRASVIEKQVEKGASVIEKQVEKGASVIEKQAEKGVSVIEKQAEKGASVIERQVSAIKRQASEIEREVAAAAANSTHSDGGARANGGSPPSSALASVIAVAVDASRMASNVAMQVQAAVDRERQRREEEASASASTSTSENTQGGDQGGDANGDVSTAKSHSDKPGIDEPEIVVDVPEVEAVGTSKEEDANSVGPNDATSNKKEKGTNDGKDKWEVVAEDKVEEASDSGSSAIALPVLSRWAVQLEHLRQLGFTDDHRSINALETLQAANLGVDSTDEVTVGDAVNYLLNNAEK